MEARLAVLHRQTSDRAKYAVKLHRAPRGHSVVRVSAQQPPDAQNIALISHEPLRAKQAPIFDGLILDVGIEQESLVILKLMVEVRMQADAAQPKEREKPTFIFQQVSYNPFHSR